MHFHLIHNFIFIIWASAFSLKWDRSCARAAAHHLLTLHACMSCFRSYITFLSGGMAERGGGELGAEWTPSTTAAVHALVPQPPPSPTLLRPRAAAALRASRRGAGRTKTSMRAKQAVVLLARTRERRGELGNLRLRRQGAREPTRPPLSSSRQGILAMYTRPAGWLPLTSYSECYCLLECNLT